MLLGSAACCRSALEAAVEAVLAAGEERALERERRDSRDEEGGEVDQELRERAARLGPVAIRRGTPTFAAEGMVATEIRTPISAPDFAVVSEIVPAIPASVATITE